MRFLRWGNGSRPVAALAERATAYGHDNNFDLMRLVLAVQVIFSHCYECTLGNGDDHEPLFRLTRGVVSSGGLAVDGFFVISGFLITASWERSRSGWSYLRKRVLRIYPGYIASTLVCGLIVGPMFSRSVAWVPHFDQAKRLVMSMATFREVEVTGAFADNPSPGAINNPVWTIRWEFTCYLMVMALGMTRLLKVRPLVLAALLIAVVGYASQYPLRIPAFVLGAEFVARRWARLPAFYLAGVALYLYRDRVPIRGRLAAVCVAGVLAGVAYPPALSVALVVCGSYLLIWFAYQPIVRWPNFAKRGDYSYGVYLYGFPVQQSLVAIFGERLSPMALMALATPISVAAGWASWSLVESRFVKPRGPRAQPP